jgi:hypothetical protein
MEGKDTLSGTIGATPTCANCGSERVVVDAWACWSPYCGLWELETTFDQAYCKACEAQTTCLWIAVEQPPDNRVRELNDAFRTRGEGNGSVMVTQGLSALGQRMVGKAVAEVRSFDAFTQNNDPYGEHDFGAVEIEGQKVFWKIDYYDLALQQASPDAANAGVTHRVLTIMLADEY